MHKRLVSQYVNYTNLIEAPSVRKKVHLCRMMDFVKGLQGVSDVYHEWEKALKR
jgi:hypothetical protein